MKIIVVKVVVTSDEVDEENKSFKFLGTAFFVDKQTVITATHVIENHSISDDERLYLIDVPNGGEIAVDKALIIKCENTDISILKLKFPINEIENVAFSSSSLKMQKKVEIQGYGSSSGGKEELTYTISGQYNEYYAVKLQGSTKRGFSGSPVLIDEKVYGVAHASDDFSTYIIPISEICDNSILNPVDDKGNVVKNPYKGLNSFTYKDQHNFYGREKESQEIAESLKNCRLYTLLGASGSGKSSLIFAGVKPLIENDEISIIDFRLNDEPFKDLVDELVVKADTDSFLKNPKERIEELKKEEYDLDTLMKRFLEHVKGKEKIYLIIDQFEELFTSEKDKVDIKVLFNQLLTLINSNLEITVVIVMRTDFLVKFSDFESFNNAYNEQSKLNLTQLAREQLRKVIVEPAKGLGVTFQDGLVNQIIEEIENKAGQLPVLEFALEQLWNDKVGKVITHEVLDSMGGVTHAISNHAEKIYHEKADKQESIKKVFMKLVNPARQLGDATNAYDTRRIASFDEFDKKEIETIRELATNRLVVTRELTNEKDDEKKIVVDIIHEALIREWDRLKDWIVEHRDFLIWQEQLEKDRMFYLESGAKKEDLLVESKLLKATQLLGSHGGYISPLDRNFIDTSITRAKEKKRNKMFLLILLAFVFTGLTGFMLFSWGQTGKSLKEVKKQKIIAQKELNKNLLTQGVSYREANKILKYKHTLAKAITYKDSYNSFDEKFMYGNRPLYLGKIKKYINIKKIIGMDTSMEEFYLDENLSTVTFFDKKISLVKQKKDEVLKQKIFNESVGEFCIDDTDSECSVLEYNRTEYYIKPSYGSQVEKYTRSLNLDNDYAIKFKINKTYQYDSTYNWLPIVIPHLDMIILSGRDNGNQNYGWYVLIDKMSNQEEIDEDDFINNKGIYQYQNSYNILSIFLSKKKNYLISYAPTQLNITKIDEEPVIGVEINTLLDGAFHIKDNFFLYWHNTKIYIIVVDGDKYKTVLKLNNSSNIKNIFFNEKNKELTVIGNNTLLLWDISMLFEKLHNKYMKEDLRVTSFDEYSEEENKSMPKRGIDLFVSKREVRVENMDKNETIYIAKYKSLVELDLKIKNSVHGVLSKNTEKLLSWSCDKYYGSRGGIYSCDCELRLTNIVTGFNLIKTEDTGCIVKANFLKKNNGIYVENYKGKSTLYKTNSKNLDNKLYRLKTIVDTGTILNDFGELKILTPDEWKDKKEEYEKKLKESKNK